VSCTAAPDNGSLRRRRSSPETGQVSIFLGSHYIVTVWHGDRSGLEQARATLDEMPTTLSHGPAAVLWAICDAVVDKYESVTGSIEADVDAIETAVFGASCTSEAERIYMLKREVLEMRRAVVPLREPIELFASADALHVDSDTLQVDSDAAVYFRNVAGHVARVCEQTDSLDKLLGSALDAHVARASVQQNDDMRRISAWVAIAAGPTVITAIYGMNFDRMPELHWHYGYFMVLGFIAAACIALYTSFRRSGWL